MTAEEYFPTRFINSWRNNRNVIEYTGHHHPSRTASHRRDAENAELFFTDNKRLKNALCVLCDPAVNGYRK